MDYAIGNLSVERETESSMQLGEISNSEGRQVVSRVCELLSLLYFKICRDSSPINVFDEERCRDAMGFSSAMGVPIVKGCPVRCADADLPGS